MAVNGARGPCFPHQAAVLGGRQKINKLSEENETWNGLGAGCSVLESGHFQVGRKMSFTTFFQIRKLK